MKQNKCPKCKHGYFTTWKHWDDAIVEFCDVCDYKVYKHGGEK
jgi:hypothetical protein